MYDVIIIGAGPGGIFAAYELVQHKPQLKVAVFEAGHALNQRRCPIDGDKIRNCINCKSCSIMSGFGGAGAFSDGKYNITNDFGGTLYEYIGRQRALELMHYVDEINMRFGGEGTGAKTMFRYDWKVGSKVRFRIVAEPDGADRIKFTGYIGDGADEMKIATISRLSHGKKPVVSGVYSFVEDFWRNVYSKTIVRRAEFTGFASRVAEKDNYTPANAARFTADGNKLMTIDAGPVKGGGFLQTGGKTENKTVKLGNWFKFN